MNTGQGHHEFLEPEDVKGIRAKEKEKGLAEHEIPIFGVGEIVQVKGMPYRVHRIERKKLVLKPLKVQLTK